MSQKGYHIDTDRPRYPQFGYHTLSQLLDDLDILQLGMMRRTTQTERIPLNSVNVGSGRGG